MADTSERIVILTALLLVVIILLSPSRTIEPVSIGTMTFSDMIDPEQALEHGWKGFVNVSYISDIPVRMIASPGKITNYTIQLKLIPHVPEFTETLISLDPEASSKSGAGWGDPAPIFNDYIRYSPSGLMRLSVEHPLT